MSSRTEPRQRACQTFVWSLIGRDRLHWGKETVSCATLCPPARSVLSAGRKRGALADRHAQRDRPVELRNRAVQGSGLPPVVPASKVA